jgi:hypothetical protein
MGAGGQEARKVLAIEPPQMAYLRGWSGDGRRFLYLRHSPASSNLNSALASLDLAEHHVITLVSDPRLMFGYIWTGRAWALVSRAHV